MKVLGIDPGTATTGYGVIEVKRSNINVLGFDLIETDKNGSPELRLKKIHQNLLSIFNEFDPDVMAIEKLFFAANAKTAMRVGQAQGIMLLAAAQKNKKVFEYAPGTIKKTLTGDGRADKKKIQRHVRKILGNGVRSRPKKKTHFDNAADALAVAVCHILKKEVTKNNKH